MGRRQKWDDSTIIIDVNPLHRVPLVIVNAVVFAFCSIVVLACVTLHFCVELTLSCPVRGGEEDTHRRLQPSPLKSEEGGRISTL
ncbi:hypothetical protein MRX96_007996 [Rhipicephalus microplus]